MMALAREVFGVDDNNQLLVDIASQSMAPVVAYGGNSESLVLFEQGPVDKSKDKDYPKTSLMNQNHQPSVMFMEFLGDGLTSIICIVPRGESGFFICFPAV